MKYNNVVFDLDGTLLNTIDDIASSINAMLAKNNYPSKTLSEVTSYVGNGVKKMVERAILNSCDEADVKRCMADYLAHYETNKANKTMPYEGVYELLEKLKQSGVKMAVVTNKTESDAIILVNQLFGKYINVTIGDSPKYAKKPAPDGVFAALNKLNAKAEDSIFVGDSEVDIQTGKAAKLFTVGVSWGFRDKSVLIAEGADIIVDTPNQILDVVLGKDKA